MPQATQPYKRSLSGSVGAGVKSVLGSNGRTYYVLVHKVTSKYHKAGESQPIIVDQIEIGRGSQCQVRFDDSFTTVSRRHAAIVRDGDNWKLVQLSTTNSTYLNGHHVHKEWYLQNGDEIQLSTNGPKLGFIIPEGDKGKVSSIGLTARLNLFRKQALRPYKTALTILGCVLLLALGGLVWSLIRNYQTDKKLVAAVERSDSLRLANDAKIARLNDSIKQMGIKADSLSSQLNKMKTDNEKLKKSIGGLRAQMKRMVGPSSAELKEYAPYVYFVISSSLEITLPDGGGIYNIDCSSSGLSWYGTGFLLDDGTFVTARHVEEHWYFWNDGDGVKDTFFEMNRIVENGGRVVAHFIAASSSGDVFEFTSRQVRCSRAKDSHDTYNSDGGVVRVSLARSDDTDCATVRTSMKGGLKYDVDASRNLKANTNLTIIGFPYGLGVQQFGNISPINAKATVARDGLHKGMIVTTATGSEHGNSGGPVFYMNNSGKLVVIGIVSAGIGNNTGLMVPIAAIR